MVCWTIGTSPKSDPYAIQHLHLIHACLCGLAQFLGVPHLPQRLSSSPRHSNSSFHILARPLLCAGVPSQIHKVLRLLQFLSFHLQAKLLFYLSQKMALCLLYAYLHAHFLLTCATPVIVFSSSASREMSSANLKSHILSPPMSAPSFDPSSAIAIIISRNNVQ